MKTTHSLSISPSPSPLSSPSLHLSLIPITIRTSCMPAMYLSPKPVQIRGCFNEPVCEDWFDWYLSRKHLIEFDSRPWLVIWEGDDHRDADQEFLPCSLRVSSSVTLQKGRNHCHPCIFLPFAIGRPFHCLPAGAAQVSLQEFKWTVFLTKVKAVLQN